jgi:hypothetical protein
MAERLSDEHLLIRLQRRADESRLAELRGPARLLPQGVMSQRLMPQPCPVVSETSDP